MPDSFFLESSESQVLPASDPILAGGNQLAFVPGSTDTSSFTTSPGSSSFPIADGTLCPGENRSAFCCDASGCSRTSVCGLGETLNCCTIDPSTTWGYRDCKPVEPASSTGGSFGDEASLLAFLNQPSYETEDFLQTDPAFNFWYRFLQSASFSRDFDGAFQKPKSRGKGDPAMTRTKVIAQNDIL